MRMRMRKIYNHLFVIIIVSVSHKAFVNIL